MRVQFMAAIKLPPKRLGKVMLRRKFLKSAISGTAISASGGCAISRTSPKTNKVAFVAREDGGGDSRIRGAFPILSTPYEQSGAVDYDVLAKEARFVADCKCQGAIWPQSGDSCDLLTVDEKLKGMEEIAKSLEGKKTVATFGCQGKTAEEMTVLAKWAEKLASKYKTSIAVISRPPDDAVSQDDLKKYYLELEKCVNRPVIIQTAGGINYKGPAPSVELLVWLAKHNPDIFGYIKEESGGSKCNERMAAEIAAKPSIHTVFSAWGSWQWLHQARRIGSEGVITERPAYADLLAYIWEQIENGDRNDTLNDAYSKYLLMLNLKHYIPGDDLRGLHLYVLQKRGIFKNRLSRAYGKKNGKIAIPSKPIIKDMKLTQAQKDEIETCFASLSPYLSAQ